jgi:LysM repeat protein
MKKVFRLIPFYFLLPLLTSAQAETLIVKKGDKGLYCEHKLKPKENFYSIGRAYHVHPKDLATFNKLDMKKPLAIGQVIRIPLTDSNFSRKDIHGVPVYYVADGKENVIQVSLVNKISVQDLRKWNNFSGDKIPAGTRFIVGYLIAGDLAGDPKKPIDDNTNKTVVQAKEPVSIQPVELDQHRPKGIEKNIQVDSTKKEEKPALVNPVIPVQKKEPAKETAPVEISENDNTGYFKSDFEQQVKVYPLSKEEMVTSGVFKVTSGGKDAKFYALMDSVEPGTVIRIANPANNKIIYAKVLGEMKGFWQNQGLDIRISDTAASALEIKETDKFIVKVNY